MSQQMYPPDEGYRGYQAEEPSAAPREPGESYSYQPPRYEVGGQKINQYSNLPQNHQGLSSGQRLALGIVSIAVLVPISAIVLDSGNSSGIAVVARLIALGLIALTIMVINIAFNWRR